MTKRTFSSTPMYAWAPSASTRISISTFYFWWSLPTISVSCTNMLRHYRLVWVRIKCQLCLQQMHSHEGLSRFAQSFFQQYLQRAAVIHSIVSTLSLSFAKMGVTDTTCLPRRTTIVHLLTGVVYWRYYNYRSSRGGYSRTPDLAIPHLPYIATWIMSLRWHLRAHIMSCHALRF